MESAQVSSSTITFGDSCIVRTATPRILVRGGGWGGGGGHMSNGPLEWPRYFVAQTLFSNRWFAFKDFGESLRLKSFCAVVSVRSRRRSVLCRSHL